MRNNYRGFTLLELLIVVVVVGLLAALAVIGYTGVMKGTKNAVQTTRLMQVADAQARFKTGMGKRRYATMAELCEQRMLPETVIKFSEGCEQSPINGWSIAMDEAQDLRHHFFARLLLEARSSKFDQTPSYCIGEDGVLRKSVEGDPGSTEPPVCDLNSPPVDP